MISVTKRVVLCADEESLRNPQLLGLEESSLQAVSWIECCATAEECRRAARRDGIEEAWVVSCDDMEPLNVAAALKYDDPFKKVYLACAVNNGSLASRASVAKVDGVLSQACFVDRFVFAKSLWDERGRKISREEEEDPSFDRNDGCGKEPDMKPANGAKACAEEGECESQASLVLDDPTQSCKERRCVSKEGAGTVVAVVGASGGCGKSTIATLLASLCAKAGLVTLAIDADLQFGDMHRMLGVREPVRMDEVVANPSLMARLNEDAKSTGKPSLVAAPSRLESSEEIAGELPDIIDAARGDYDVVVACAGAFWSEIHARLIESADSVVFLMDARPTSLEATVHAVELCARMGLATSGFVYAINKHERESLLSAVDASCALKGSTAIELSNGRRDVEELLGAGFVQEFIESRNPLTDEVVVLLEKILSDEQVKRVSQSLSSKSRRGRLFGRKARR